MSRHNYILIAGLLVEASPAFSANEAKEADGSKLDAPETEFALAKTELVNIHNRLKTISGLTHRHGLGPQTANAERAFENGKRFFSLFEFLSTIRELNLYLNLNQVPDTDRYLESQYMIARSYEETGFDSRALRAYFRYLQAFVSATTKNYGELLDVVRRVLPLAHHNEESTKKSFDVLLSSLSALDMPSDLRPSLLYHIAKAAANNGNVKLAETWLAEAMKHADDPIVRSRAHYVRALIYLNQKNYDAAEQTLGDVMTIEDKNGATADSVKDLARLALGRIAIHRRKPATAIKYYEKIEESSGSFKEALFESVYLLLELKREEEARSKAMLFVARFPNTSEADQIRMVVAYLDLRAGDAESAGATLKASDDRLAQIKTWLTTNMSAKQRVTHVDMLNLMVVTDRQIPPTPTVAEGNKLFQRIAELQRRLADARGEVHNVVYTVGRMNLEHFQPEWVNRAEQLSQIGDDLLRVGHRLVGVERNLYADRLSETDKLRLTSSETRRTRLLTKPAYDRRKMRHWSSLADFMDMTATLAAHSSKLASAESELASARYLDSVSKGPKSSGDRAKKIAHLQGEVERAATMLKRSLETVRIRKIEDFLHQSPHRATQKFLSQYAIALHDEGEILHRVRQVTGSGASKLLSEDGEQAWSHWQFLAKTTYEAITALDDEIKAGLGGFIATIEDHEKRYGALSEELRLIQSSLETQMGAYAGEIVSQYGGQINTRLARHKKWSADINWIDYSRENEESKAAKAKFDLEQEILRENLTDLQQGALWKWQD